MCMVLGDLVSLGSRVSLTHLPRVDSFSPHIVVPKVPNDTNGGHCGSPVGTTGEPGSHCTQGSEAGERRARVEPL